MRRVNPSIPVALATICGLQTNRSMWTQKGPKETVYSLEVTGPSKQLYVLQVLEDRSHEPIRGYSAAAVKLEGVRSVTELNGNNLVIVDADGPPFWDEENMTPRQRLQFQDSSPTRGNVFVSPLDIFICGLYYILQQEYKNLPEPKSFHSQLKGRIKEYLATYSEPIYIEKE